MLRDRLMLTASSGVAPLVPTTWDPSNQTSITFSGGNLVATNNTTTLGGTRALVSRASGKYYWETSVSLGSSFSTATGVADATWSTAAGESSGGVFLNSNANISVNGTNVSTATSYTSSDIVSVAVDMSSALIWFRVNGGTWGPSGDPAAGTGGQSFSGSGLGPAMFAACVAKRAVVTANFGATSFSYTVPSGFSGGFG